MSQRSSRLLSLEAMPSLPMLVMLMAVQLEMLLPVAMLMVLVLRVLLALLLAGLLMTLLVLLALPLTLSALALGMASEGIQFQRSVSLFTPPCCSSRIASAVRRPLLSASQLIVHRRSHRPLRALCSLVRQRSSKSLGHLYASLQRARTLRCSRLLRSWRGSLVEVGSPCARVVKTARPWA